MSCSLSVCSCWRMLLRQPLVGLSTRALSNRSLLPLRRPLLKCKSMEGDFLRTLRISTSSAYGTGFTVHSLLPWLAPPRRPWSTTGENDIGHVGALKYQAFVFLIQDRPCPHPKNALKSDLKHLALLMVKYPQVPELLDQLLHRGWRHSFSDKATVGHDWFLHGRFRGKQCSHLVCCFSAAF